MLLVASLIAEGLKNNDRIYDSIRYLEERAGSAIAARTSIVFVCSLYTRIAYCFAKKILGVPQLDLDVADRQIRKLLHIRRMRSIRRRSPCGFAERDGFDKA